MITINCPIKLDRICMEYYQTSRTVLHNFKVHNCSSSIARKPKIKNHHFDPRSTLNPSSREGDVTLMWSMHGIHLSILFYSILFYSLPFNSILFHSIPSNFLVLHYVRIATVETTHVCLQRRKSRKMNIRRFRCKHCIK